MSAAGGKKLECRLSPTPGPTVLNGIVRVSIRKKTDETTCYSIQQWRPHHVDNSTQNSIDTATGSSCTRRALTFRLLTLRGRVDAGSQKTKSGVRGARLQCSVRTQHATPDERWQQRKH